VREKGVKFTHNPFLKKSMYLVGTSFVRVRWGYYNDLYYKFREKYDSKPCPKEARGIPHKVKNAVGQEVVVKCEETRHRHMMALRMVEKIFLSHMMRVWRKLEGKPEVAPYVFEDHPKTNFAKHDNTHEFPIPWDGDRNWPKPDKLRAKPKDVEQDEIGEAEDPEIGDD
jgi:uncharacterized protein Veg